MNHRLTEVDCTNFQSVLIVGKSQKNDRISNGVGKTTILSAIEYALFNQSHATTLDKVVRDGKKKAVVEFDFELNSEVYRIYRHRSVTGSSDVRLYKLNGTEFESICERTPSATDSKIHELIKISHKAFTYSVLFRQADLTGLTSVTDPKKRKEILKEPLNLGTYTKLEEMAVDKRRPLKSKISNIEGSIQVIGNPDDDINKAESELVSNQAMIKSLQDSVTTNEEVVTTNRAQVDDLKQSLDQQDVDIHRKVIEHEELLKKLKTSAKAKDKRLLNLSELLISKEAELKKFDLEIENSESIKKNLASESGKDFDELQLLYKKICDDEVKGSEMLAAVKAQMKLTKKSLPDSDQCPTCQQSITSEYRREMENDVTEKICKLQEEAEFLEDALGKCRRKKIKLDEGVKAEQKRVNDLDKIVQKIESSGKAIIALRGEIDRLYTDQKDTTKALQDEERQIHETQEHLDTLKEAADKSNSPTINKKIFELNQKIKDAYDAITESNRRITSLSTVQGGLKERIKTRKSDKEKLTVLKDTLIKDRRELKIAQMVVDAFSGRGIPNFIIQTVLDELQFEANKALKELRPELDVKIDSELNFEYRRNGIQRDYEQLSHGQHVYIALAFKRGLSMVIQKKLGITINLLAFDEVDAHLDDEGIEAFADAIRKWQKDFSIFVITHNKDLQDKFSHAILVEESENDGAEARLVSIW
jgi:DNA repair exonuclease SbcCD ATPase subunit